MEGRSCFLRRRLVVLAEQLAGAGMADVMESVLLSFNKARWEMVAAIKLRIDMQTLILRARFSPTLINFLKLNGLCNGEERTY